VLNLRLYKGVVGKSSVLHTNVDNMKLLEEHLKMFKLMDEENVGEILERLARILFNVHESFGKIAESIDEEVKYDEDEDDLDEKIREWLSEQKFRMEDLTDTSFIYQGLFDGSAHTKGTPEKMKRLKQELAALSNSLPDGIYLCVNEDRYDMMKVMIVGPHGTPYEMGCFLFDLYIPADYPQVCPKMTFLTTGSSTMYFNPNLYTNGKVCLSLLGTWDGPGWDPETSTLLQLLVSIQALVFVDFPYENEPGCENSALGTTSLAYNKGIHLANTIYAMLWQLEDKNVPSCFRDIIRAHFYLNRHYIVTLLDKWETYDANVASYCSYYNWENTLLMQWEPAKTGLIEALNALEVPRLEQDEQ